MPALILIGAGGHFAVAAEVARLTGYVLKGALAKDAAAGARAGPVEILGGDEQIERFAAEGCVFHIALTDPNARHRLRNEMERRSITPVSLIHPRAIVSPAARVGDGCFIAAGAIISAGAVLGPGVVVNTGAQIDHDSRIGADCHIAPRAILAGGVHCGERVFVALGAIVAPNIRIGADSVVGAGATVLRDVGDGVTVVGTPARPLAR